MTAPQDPFGAPGDPSRSSGGTPPAAPGYGQQGADQPGYGSQPAWGASGDQQPGGRGKSNGLGIAALVVGLVSLLAVLTIVGGIVLGLVAIVLGVLARGKVNKGEADNGGMAIAGIVLGAVSLLLSLAFIAFGVAIFSSGSGQDLVQCIEQAAGDPAAEQQCEAEFQQDFGE